MDLRHELVRKCYIELKLRLLSRVQVLTTTNKMNSLSVSVFMVCTLVATCSANTYRMGACPRVTVMKTVDFDKVRDLYTTFSFYYVRNILGMII